MITACFDQEAHGWPPKSEAPDEFIMQALILVVNGSFGAFHPTNRLV